MDPMIVELSALEFSQMFDGAKAVGTDTCYYDDKPLVATGVSDCVCIFAHAPDNSMFGAFHSSACYETGNDDIVDIIGSLPPAEENVLEFVDNQGDGAMFAVVAGSNSPSVFFNAVCAFVRLNIPADCVLLIAHIPTHAKCSNITFCNGKVIFMQES
eukprot:gene22680-29833_t